MLKFIVRGSQFVAKIVKSNVPLVAKSATLKPAIKARSEVGFDAPKISRDFGRDYPGTARTDGAGRLSADIEGRPLNAPIVIGRRTAGGSDHAISPDELSGLAVQLKTKIGTAPPSRVLNGDGKQAGGVYLKLPSGDRQIRIADNLTPGQQQLVVNHEMGHVIGEVAKKTKVAPGAEKVELESVYHQLRTGQAPVGLSKVTPQADGYAPKDWNSELIAEGMRAYLTSPAWFKSVAPTAAAALRESVNTSKTLSKHIQLNSVAAPAGAVAVGVAAATAGSGNADASPVGKGHLNSSAAKADKAPRAAIATAAAGSTYTRTYTSGPKAGTTETVRKAR